MTRMLRVLLVALAFTPLLPAVEPKQLAEAISPILNDSTVVVIHVDLAKFDLAAIKGRLVKLAPKSTPVLDEPFAGLAQRQKVLVDAGFHNLFVAIGTTQDPNKIPLLALTQDVPQKGDPLEKVGGLFPGGLTKVGNVFVAGPPGVAKTLPFRQHVPVDALVADLTAALQNAEKSPVRVAVLLSPSIRRVLEENLPKLPPPFADVGGKLFAQGFRWAVLAMDGDTTTGYKLRLHLQADSPETAKTFARLAETGLDALAAIPEVTKVVPLPKIRKEFTLRTDGPTLVTTMEDRLVLEALGPGFLKAQYSMKSAESINHLKMIGLAFHLHLSGNKNRFPTAAITDNQGQPLLSWRVRLLPHLGEENKKLYERLKLNEPWDSEHNKKLLSEMPAVYRSSLDPKLAEVGKTTIVVPVGADTIFPVGKPVGIFDITDGTSNTILALEVDATKAVPWTKPDDLVVDLKKPLAGLGFDEEGLVKTLFADGSVRRIARSIAPGTFAAMLTRNGGEVINEP